MKEKKWHHTGNTEWEDDLLYGGELFEDIVEKHVDRLEYKDFARKHWIDQKTGA